MVVNAVDDSIVEESTIDVYFPSPHAHFYSTQVVTSVPQGLSKSMYRFTGTLVQVFLLGLPRTPPRPRTRSKGMTNTICFNYLSWFTEHNKITPNPPLSTLTPCSCRLLMSVVDVGAEKLPVLRLSQLKVTPSQYSTRSIRK